jgi:hypothetical protein
MYLEKQSHDSVGAPTSVVRALIKAVHDRCTRGFCVELYNYLKDATDENPKRGFGTSRTALWGLQRPPHRIGLKTLIRCSKETTFDTVAPLLLLFFGTTAHSQVEVSIHPDNTKLLAAFEHRHLPLLLQTEAQFETHKKDTANIYNLIDMSKNKHPMKEFPMVGHFVSLYFPLGHIKSTMPDDEEFLGMFSSSEKWLHLRTEDEQLDSPHMAHHRSQSVPW